jgi:hypothetical protein
VARESGRSVMRGLRGAVVLGCLITRGEVCRLVLRHVGYRKGSWLGERGGGEGPVVQQGALLVKHHRERESRAAARST